MKNSISKSIVCLILISCSINAANPELRKKYPDGFIPKENNTLSFKENKGQFCDQNGKSRPDILFAGVSGDLSFYLSKQGISYQLNKAETWRDLPNIYNEGLTDTKTTRVPDKIKIYRMDINWLNINQDITILKGKENGGSENYYTMASDNGINNVKSFENVTYNNLYSGIDLKWYQKNGKLKYDYIAKAGSDFKQIQLEYKGAESVKLNKKGDAVFKTPFGEVIEEAPVVIQNGKSLKVVWNINEINKNNETVFVLSFNIKGLDSRYDYIIDPVVRTWGTYYGGTNGEVGYACTTHTNGDVYLAGMTTSATTTLIATTGSHQSSIAGTTAAFLVKFNSAGVRQWGTYYGSGTTEIGYACTTDPTGNIYLAGRSNGIGTLVATPGSHQPTPGGGLFDAFLAKFDASGVRQWGTFYGGTGDELVNFCATDNLGNVFITGYSTTNSGTLIASAGSHQSTHGGGTDDAFLVKFNSAGVRQWGTYYGGTGAEKANGCAAYTDGSVYIAGFTSTNSGTAIASVGSHQPNHGGDQNDAFLVKFNSAGVRQWGTYYGGTCGAPPSDQGQACATDGFGNVFLTGMTCANSGTVIATVGSHQPSYVQSYDGFVVKFNSSGVRQWGTYYGGNAADNVRACLADAAGNVYFGGNTSSTTFTSQIATVGSHETNGTGSGTGFLVKLDMNGVRQWGTYYGTGSGTVTGLSCARDASGNLFLCGSAVLSSTNAIATLGSHQSNQASGTTDGYLAKFSDCVEPNSPTNTTNALNLNICSGKSSTLTASGTGTINWFSTSTSTTVLNSGTSFITPTLTAGTYTYYAEALTCASSLTRTAITITVNSIPGITVNSGSICIGKTFTMVPAGGVSYTYSSGSNTVSPTVNSTYTVIGASAQGCTNTITSTVTINATPTINVSGGSVCPGGSFTFNPTGANTYTYSNGQIVTPVATTNYTITGSSAQGCTATPVVATVVYTNNLTVSIGGLNTVCNGQPITLTANGASTYTWSTGSTSSIITPSPTTNTTYSVVGSSGTCSNNAVVSITVNPNPTVTAISSTSLICTGQTTTLTASGANSYVWNPSGSGSTIVISPTVTSSYTVIGTGANGCLNSSVITQSVSLCTSVATISKLENFLVSIYPNPTNGDVNINLSSTAQVLIINMLGQVLFAADFNEGPQNLDIRYYAKGIYFVNVIQNGHQQSIKLIKE